MLKQTKKELKNEIATVNQFDRWLEKIKRKMKKDIKAIKERMPYEYPDMPKKEAELIGETTTEYLFIKKLEKMFEDSLAIMRKYLDEAIKKS